MWRQEDQKLKGLFLVTLCPLFPSSVLGSTTLPFKIISRVLFTQGWPQTPGLIKDDLEFPSILPSISAVLG